jgi:protein TonB
MAASTFENRPMGALGRMTIVAGIHLAVFYCIAAGLGVVPVPPIVSMDATVINEERPIIDPPPLPPPPLDDPRPQVTEPVVRIDTQTETTTPDFDVRPIDEPIGPTTGSAVTEVPATSVMQDSRHPLTQPAYPPASKRDGEQGAGVVEVFVLPNGRVGDVRIASSTGFERLDRAALQEARQSWRFKPATRAGEAVAQWYKVRVVFKLTEAR